MLPEHNGYGDLLILNLASRKQFWIRKTSIDNQIKAKATDVDGRFAFSTPTGIKIGAEEIKIGYEMNLIFDTLYDRYSTLKTLGNFKYPKFIY